MLLQQLQNYTQHVKKVMIRQITNAQETKKPIQQVVELGKASSLTFGGAGKATENTWFPSYFGRS